jgi:hypothetical protein
MKTYNSNDYKLSDVEYYLSEDNIHNTFVKYVNTFLEV